MLNFSNGEEQEKMRFKSGKESMKSKMLSDAKEDKRDSFSKNPIKFIKELKNLATVTGEDKNLHIT